MVKFELHMNSKFNNLISEQKITHEAEKILLDVMKAIRYHATRLAPVDTGDLRKSLEVVPDYPASVIRVTDGVSYGVHQEYGTYKMRAQPFMRPAKDIAIKLDFPKIVKKYGKS